jgi:hypothetical protein
MVIMSQSTYPIELTEEERDTLNSITSHGIHRAQKITRARILLQADDGKSHSAVARVRRGEHGKSSTNATARSYRTQGS